MVSFTAYIVHSLATAAACGLPLKVKPISATNWSATNENTKTDCPQWQAKRNAKRERLQRKTKHNRWSNEA